MRRRPAAPKKPADPDEPHLAVARRRALSTSQRAIDVCDYLLSLLPAPPPWANRTPHDRYEAFDAATMMRGLLSENVAANQRIACELAIVIAENNMARRRRNHTAAEA